MMNWFGNKNGRDKRSGSSGCGSGLVHVIKHHHWPHFMRRLTHHHKNKRLMPTRTNDMEEQDKLIVGEEATEGAPPKNTSIKARMKALLAEEIYKLKGSRRHRSSSYDVTQSDDTLNPESEPTTGSESSDHTERDKSLASFKGNVDTTNEYMKPTRNGEDSLLISHPKDYLDALGIISANEEFLVKVLQDPGSPLAHHFRNQQALSARRGLMKSETFPLPGSSREKSYKPSRLKPKPDSRTDHGETQLATKRFRDLKQKIKHVIREGKKEMHRVAMDGIIHKIPHGHHINNVQFMIFETYEGKGSPSSGSESDFSLHSFNKYKPTLRKMTRASSLNESLDRYRQLYETSFSQQVKHQTFYEGRGLRRKKYIPKHMARIYSLPDMKTYDLNQNEESFDTFSTGVASQSDSDFDVHTRHSFDEQTSQDLPLSSIDKLPMESIVEEDLLELNPTMTLPENDCQTDESEEPVLLVDEVAKTDLSKQLVSETEEKNTDEDSMCDISSVEVNAEERAEFSYVKDILELSGFSGDGFLGSWHSNDQPVSPLVYEEAKGCLVFDPDCCGNSESGGKCDHPHLFDLINEVLMEIYAKSYSYYPFPLSTLSRTSPVPTGQHVLREVWGLISFYLSLRLEVGQSLDVAVASDLAKSGWWMNLQFDCECVGLELEDLIFHDLLEEAICD